MKAEEMKLHEVPKGSLFRYDETIGFVSEYSTDKGAIEAYILGSGEMFWGGTTEPMKQRELRVEVIDLNHQLTELEKKVEENLKHRKSIVMDSFEVVQFQKTEEAFEYFLSLINELKEG